MAASCLFAVFTYDNGPALRQTLSRIPAGFQYPVVVHVDGSTDGSDACLGEFRYPVLRNEVNRGTGRSLKNVVAYARKEGYQILTFVAGNNKNDPGEAPRLVEPILSGEADYVQGSRYLPGSRRDNTPRFRLVMVKAHALLFSLLTGRRCTDALEGVRAYRLSIFDDPRIDIWQEWLDSYELETYIHYRVLTGPYRYKEVPISKIYPADRRHLLWSRGGVKYSHIRPFVDWWRILRPLVFLILRIKR